MSNPQVSIYTSRTLPTIHWNEPRRLEGTEEELECASTQRNLMRPKEHPGASETERKHNSRLNLLLWVQETWEPNEILLTTVNRNTRGNDPQRV